MKNLLKEISNKLPAGLKQYHIPLFVSVLGLLLLLMPSGKQNEPPVLSPGEPFDLTVFEEKMARTLSQINGAGKVEVALSLSSGSRRVLAQDQQWEGEDSQSSTVTLGRGGGMQEVVPLQTVSPMFRGAVVVCPGGGNPYVRLALQSAVSALTGLGADRICICQSSP